MTQQEVLNLLQKKKDWISIKEINKMLNYTSGQANLNKLYKQGLVIRKKVNEKGYNYLMFRIK